MSIGFRNETDASVLVEVVQGSGHIISLLLIEAWVKRVWNFGVGPEPRSESGTWVLYLLLYIL
jgi:hypothetical protein